MASMKVNHLKRREFITLLGGAATWPLRAQAQQPERMRRIGVLMSFDENDPTMKLRVSAFTQALADLGWTDGRNVRMDFRGAGGDINRVRALAQELVGLRPDIIVADGTPEADRRIGRVLHNDPGIGVVRHADAGYAESRKMLGSARFRMPSIPGDDPQ